MKNYTKVTAFVFLASFAIHAQTAQKTGNNPTMLNQSAVFEIESTNKGFLPPRMTTIQRDAITTPATGLVVYNTDTKKLEIWDGISWSKVAREDNLGLGNITSKPVFAHNQFAAFDCMNHNIIFINSGQPMIIQADKNCGSPAFGNRYTIKNIGVHNAYFVGHKDGFALDNKSYTGQYTFDSNGGGAITDDTKSFLIAPGTSYNFIQLAHQLWYTF
ncbi:hypothetical protein [Flavobacterium poyangense]|uniref:hypothetical protein n=1 Tax=Flavobacterium poyangense TaxID=2204302 RepID=UPI001420E518|nr:hypothetical protein [Flavobacterium sp. JXAS1]